VTAAVPFGQTRPKTLEDFWNYLERVQNGTVPFRKLEVAGPVATEIRTVTVAMTVLITDSTILADATGGAFAVNLPPAATCEGRVYVVKRLNAGANAVTVTPAGAETIDGAATAVLGAQYAVVMLQSDGVNWFIL